jgi:hypothetical protein
LADRPSKNGTGFHFFKGRLRNPSANEKRLTWLILFYGQSVENASGDQFLVAIFNNSSRVAHRVRRVCVEAAQLYQQKAAQWERWIRHSSCTPNLLNVLALCDCLHRTAQTGVAIVPV